MKYVLDYILQNQFVVISQTETLENVNIYVSLSYFSF